MNHSHHAKTRWIEDTKANDTLQVLAARSLSRRHFLGASVGALGALWLARPASAQSAMPATNAPQVLAGTKTNVFTNRAPLQTVPFYALPLGSVRARGWALGQLELQRDGLTGHAPELLPAVQKSAWLGGEGENWEKGPYYLKGLVTLAYTLDDEELKGRVQKWVEPILKSQRDDGNFGPENNDDWWPRMVVTWLMRDYHEATGDERVLPFLSKYYAFVGKNMPARPLRDWGKARAGDEIDTVLWLYNRTGENSLLGVADLLHAQAYPWRDIFSNNLFLTYGDDYHPKHNVNVPQAMKMPATYWQRSKLAADRAAFFQGNTHLMIDHGLSVGMNSGTESLAGRSSGEGIETCSVVERLLSEAVALRIFGASSIGDNMEQIAFNVLPAALSRDIHQHVYYTLPNSVTAPRGGLGFMQDYHDGRTPAPISGYPCCCYNLHMGWPKVVQNSWAATANGGLAALMYLPSQVSTGIGGNAVSIVCDTNYPFEETIRLTVNVPKATRFPLQLRVPGWCKNPAIQVNGKAHNVTPNSFATIEREWKNGDVVTLRFPMQTRTERGVNDSVSVHHGPLLFALGIDEKWQVVEDKDNPPREGFEPFTIAPDSPWNYGLVGDTTFAVQRVAMTKNPFDPTQTPLSLTARARKIPDWTLIWSGNNAFDPPLSPVASTEPVETVTLKPFGAQMLRVTDFPIIGKPAPTPLTWNARFEKQGLSDWVFYGGGWFVRDGKFWPASHMGTAQAIAPKARFGDLVYEGDVMTGEKGDAGLLFRIQKATIGADNFQGYYVGIEPSANRVVLGKADGKWTEIKQATKTLDAQKAYNVRVEARGANIKVWVDDMETPIIEATDDSHKFGAVGVRHYGAEAKEPRVAFANLQARVL